MPRLDLRRDLILPLLGRCCTEGLGGRESGVTLQASPCLLTQSAIELAKVKSLTLPDAPPLGDFSLSPPSRPPATLGEGAGLGISQTLALAVAPPLPLPPPFALALPSGFLRTPELRAPPERSLRWYSAFECTVPEETNNVNVSSWRPYCQHVIRCIGIASAAVVHISI